MFVVPTDFPVRTIVSSSLRVPSTIAGLPMMIVRADMGVLRGEEVSSIIVTLDFAKVLSFNRPARTIIIGNPAIVDGTLSDEETIVLTGKSVGTTNMIVLGESGREIANLVVSVVANSNNLMSVYHGNTRQVFSCTGPCNPLAATVVSDPPPAAKE
jgi:Flp pilus assembly secretin CpaC